MALSRRRFVKRAAALIPAAFCWRGPAELLASTPGELTATRIAIDPARTHAVIPENFIGLGYEISSVARSGLLRSTNNVYVQLVKTLGKQGVIRVGGNTSDYASYSANAQPLSLPEGMGGSVINDAVLRDLGTFLETTGWQLIWGLNLGRGTLKNAIEEARAVVAAVHNQLVVFEIGNEPDLFSRHQVHRDSGYNYDSYLRQYRAWRDGLRKAIPDIRFAGPDIAVQTDWVVDFARDEGKDLVLLTHHYYREGQNPASSAEKLLHSDPKLAPMLAKLNQASRSSKVPYRICETNSFSGGGKVGVSDTFAAAVWVLEFMFTLASAGCAGINIETGVNQLGFISSYSPIGDDEHGRYWAAPEYYGMLAFAQSGPGRVIDCTIEAGKKNISAYAVWSNEARVVLTVINKENGSDASISVNPGALISFASASVCRLLAPSLESKAGVTLGGSTVSANGIWKPARLEQLRSSGNEWQIQVPAASAAIVTLHR